MRPLAGAPFSFHLPVMTAIADTIAEIESDFALFSDWEERYGHLIELGKALEPMPAALRTEATKVRGCVSQVWLHATRDGPLLHFRGDSDAAIVRGLVALMLAVFSQRTPQDILAVDARDLTRRLGLDEALTPQRSNGLAAMITRIRETAAQSGSAG
jgi:cysteine desulfuration protein SufE